MNTLDPPVASVRPYQPLPSNPFVEFPKSEIEQTLHGRFERVAEIYPAHPAVMTRTEGLTYRELNTEANRVAGAIVARCGTKAEPVALLFQQGLPSTAAILGTLKAGKFYVPLDPTLPVDGLARMLKDSRARLVVTESRNLLLAGKLCGTGAHLLDIDQLGLDVSDRNLGPTGHPGALAYIYYTSGTTGVPKGVMDTHRNVLHNIMRYTNRLHVCADDRLTLLQPFGFSGAVSSLFCALLNGACTFPVDIREETPSAIAQWLEDAGITIYHSVPALFRALLADGRILRSVRMVRLEGDQAAVADAELFRKHFGPDSLLVNGLGTTETGIACQYFIDQVMRLEGGRLPVGYPTDNMEVFLLDEHGDLFAEAGRVGEIAVASRHLSPGYWRNPISTQRAFTRDPRGGPGRVYRTGDLGRFRPDGCLEHLGRSDARLKVRGQWVVLTDIESVLLKVEGVRETVATVWEDGTGDARLVAYIVPEASTAPTVTTLRRHLAAALPAHMIPSHYVMLETFPVTHNGKIDRHALPPPSRGRPNLNHEYVAPDSLLQRRLAQVWEEILDVHPIGIRDNFFDLGGHSLLAARMVDRLEEVLCRDIPLTILFQAPDVEALADVLFQRDGDLRFPLVEIQRGGAQPPFFFLHGDYISGGYYCLELGRHLGPDRPFYVLPPCGLDGQAVPASYEEMAAFHVETLRAFRPSGPYLLGGTCNGGLVAFEMARRLVQCGQQVDLLVLIGASAVNVRFPLLKQRVEAAGSLLRLSPGARMYLYERLRAMLLNLDHLPLHRRITRLLGKARKIPGELTQLFTSVDPRGPGKSRALGTAPEGETLRERRERIAKAYRWIDQHYIPGEYANPVTLFWAENDPDAPEDAAGHWRKVSPRVDLHVIPGTHLGSLTADVRTLAEHLRRCLK